jgi:hypothetical protein
MSIYSIMRESYASFVASRCIQLTDKSIEELRLACRSLVSLDIGELSLISETAWIALFVQAPNDHGIGPIEHLNLSNTPNISDVVLYHFIKSNGFHLAALNICGCSQVTSKRLVFSTIFSYKSTLALFI